MNKLNTLRDEKADELYEQLSNGEKDYNEDRIFIEGWDAHEALNLPVLFAKWKENGISSFEIRKIDIDEYYVDDKDGESYSLQELYDYWINNIYQP